MGEGRRNVREQIRRALSEGPDWHSAGAVSWAVGAGASGPFGTEPAPEVMAALSALAASGQVARLHACPGCGQPGDLFALATRVPATAAPPAPISPEELGEAMEPLIAEGLIEVAELVELTERDCCVRSTRAWRRTPRPA